MLLEIYLWLESRSGIPYNFEDQFAELMSDMVATDPNEWMISIRNIIDLTKDAIDVVNDYDDQIPDDLPSARKIKQMIADYTRTNIRQIMIHAFGVLGLLPPESIPIAKLTTLWNMTAAISNLVNELIINFNNEESNNAWFEKYDENNDNIFTDNCGLTKYDIQQLALNIDSVREFHDEDEGL